MRTSHFARLSLSLLTILSLPGCGVGEGDGSKPPWEDPPTPVADSAEPGTGELDPIEPMAPYSVKLETTKGDVVIEVHPEGAPRGAARFKELVESGYYDGNRFFRIVPSFVVQFGMNGDPAVNAEWDNKTIPDDEVQHSNDRGTVTFATSGPNSRTTQVFINLSDNPDLDMNPNNFAPFGNVVRGMDVVDALNSEYREEPQQHLIAQRGNDYLDEQFARLDAIVKATVIDPPSDAPDSADSDTETDDPDTETDTE